MQQYYFFTSPLIVYTITQKSLVSVVSMPLNFAGVEQLRVGLSIFETFLKYRGFTKKRQNWILRAQFFQEIFQKYDNVVKNWCFDLGLYKSIFN